MAEVKNNFIKSKMNKDLDDRLVPAGEYRNAQNIAIAKSEGPNVGALENVLGNNLISNFTLPTNTYGVEIIGHFMDVKNDRIIVFMTNYVDTSSDTLSNFSPTDAYHAIGVYNLLNSVSSIVVSGRFLNFSKTHEIYGVNTVDNLLFWTDNRNQPRKINIANALANSSYYTTEDTISVSKYYPHKTIDLVAERVTSAAFLTTGGTAYGGLTLPALNLPTSNTSGSGTGYGLTVDVTAVDGTGQITAFRINNPGVGYQNMDQVVIQLIPGQVPVGGAFLILRTQVASMMQDVVSDLLPGYEYNASGITNPYRQPYVSDPEGTFGDISWRGDPEYLKDKFVKFSYRFKFDDDEYSLIAPFTQTCFVPKQDGYFLENDDAKSYKSTEIDIMQNKINDILLIINSPQENPILGGWNNIFNNMKITEIDILYKEAGQNTIKVIDTITSDEFSLIESPYLTYSYASTKPYKTLPDKEILRVHDQVPVRALSQELIGNRIVYGNYIDKPTPPTSISYSLNVDEKEVNTQIEYQNQNLKQNRTYQVGIVLSDRYGRQSSAILSSIDKSKFAKLIKGSTIFHNYKTSPFSSYPAGSLYRPDPVTGDDDVWDGDALEVQFWDIISSTKSSSTGEPGLYDSITNPLGWYSYKIVVKQQDQDYYNIYFPGILNGYIDGEAKSTGATAEEPVCHFVLAGDNINKVPRDLSLVGPNQTIFRTGRPSAQEDPSYYKFVDSSGLDFTVDPFSKEGEKLLKERDRKRDLDSGSQITNASVKLSLRLNNAVPDLAGTLVAADTTTHQAYPGTNLDVVTTVGTGSELGLWDPSAIIPFNTANVFYGYQNNPYVAKVNVDAPVNTTPPAVVKTQTGITGPHPLSGTLKFDLTGAAAPPGSGYTTGSKNVPCTIPIAGGYTISGFKVNIDSALGANALSIADIGIGWPSLVPTGGITIPNCLLSGAGDGLYQFTITVTSAVTNGKMAPSLAVYETQPLKSKLDIYWETSTNGLIDELNIAIETGDTTTPVGFEGPLGAAIVYDQDEGMAIGADLTPSGIWPIAPDGSTINGPNQATLLSVIDGTTPTGVDRTSEFTIVNNSNNSFSIVTNSYFMCDVDNNIKGEFTFNVNIQVPGSTFPIDGLYINRDLSLGPYTLDNIPPVFTNIMIDNFIATAGFENYIAIPFTSSWNTSAPPYVDHVLKPWLNETFDPDNVFNDVGGVYTCQKSGTYDISLNCDLIGSFKGGTGISSSILSGAGVEACSLILGTIFIRKVGSTTNLAMEQVVLTYNDRIHTMGFVSQYGGSGVRWNTYGTIQGGSNGWGYPSGVSRPSFENYALNVQNQSLLIGEQIEVGVSVMFVGDEPNGNLAYGYAFKDLTPPLYNNFYKSTAEAQLAILDAASFSVTASNLTTTTSPGLIHTFSAENGSNSNVANSLKTESLTYSLANDYSGLFYLTPSTTLGDVHLEKNSGGESDTPYEIKITATDGAGAAVDISSVVIIRS